jgi:hypothetical protein
MWAAERRALEPSGPLRRDRREVVNFIDDHSRLDLRSVALAVTTAVDVGRIFQQARAQYGMPASVLTDNGCIFTAEHRGGKVVLRARSTTPW